MIEVIRTGGCLCGGVQFEMQGSLRPILACHCSQCRKTSGHFWAATEVHRDQIDICDKGTLGGGTARQIMPREVSVIAVARVYFGDETAEDSLSIGAGCIGTPTRLVTGAHIFVDDASDYYEVSPSEVQCSGLLRGVVIDPK